MKDTFKEILVFMMVIFVAVLAALFTYHPATNKSSFGDSQVGYPLAQSTASSSVLTQGVSVNILATSTARSYALICNTAPTATDFLNFTAPAATNTGITIFPNSCYEMKGNNIFTGAVNVLASSTTASPNVSTLTNP